MKFNRGKLTGQELIRFYEALVKPRLIEEKMLILLRQGRVSKWFSGIGQEAIAVGVTLAMETDEYILPLHRNLGVFTTRGLPLDRLFAQLQGKKEGYSKGRERSFHFGTNEHHIVGMISHLGPQMGVADGIALANKLERKNKAVLVFTGEGGSSEGDFHESLNLAAVWDLPVIFLVENNGYGLSTPTREQFRHRSFVDKGPAYGLEALTIDGNNILEVYHTIKILAEKVRSENRPVLVEALTFRMRGHEEASGVSYVPEFLLEQWAKKDPVKNYEEFLLQEKIIDPEYIQATRQKIITEIEDNLGLALALPAPVPDTESELNEVYFPHVFSEVQPAEVPGHEIRFVDAISDGIRQCLDKFPELVIMGQDIAEYGGVFKVTEGMFKTYGKERIRNTPLCESAVIGAALGLSIGGYKSMVEMQFADFITCGFNQVVNNLAKIHYRWGQKADVVIRMPTGAGVGAGPFHSQSTEAWFFHTPGLKIVYPSSPFDAKGLLVSAVEDPNPVLYFEHKALYRSIKGQVPPDYYNLPLGKASILHEGHDISVITYGMGVHWALDTIRELTHIDAEIIDLRTLLPWDKETIERSIKKTGKVILLHEDCLTGGLGGEIAAWITEHCFEYLDGPVIRVGALDTPVPFAPSLERNFLPPDRFREKLEYLSSY